MPDPRATEALAVLGPGVDSITDTIGSIQDGDILIACGMCDGNNGPATDVDWECSDSMGNTWLPLPPQYPVGGYGFIGGGGGQVVAFYAYANGSGSTDVTLTETGINRDFHAMILAVYPAEGRVFDQIVSHLGPAQALVDPPFDNAVTSGCFNVSDTLAVTLCATQVVNLTDIDSNTGDTKRISATRVGSFPGIRLTLFDRTEEGPTSGYVQLKLDAPADIFGKCPLVTLTFSKPLARPVDFTEQYVVRTGQGQGNEEQPFTGPPYWPRNRPLTLTFPYRPLVGEALYVFALGPAKTETAPSITDTQGNTWDRLVDDNPAGSQGILSVFRTTVTTAPADGEFLQVTIDQDLPASSAVYQIAAAGGVGFVTPPTFLDIAGFLNAVNPVPLTVRLTSDTIPNVPQNARLLAFSFYSGAATQNSLTWTPLDDYTIHEQWNLIQQPVQQTNAYRLGPCAIFSKTAPAAGDYDARIDGVIDGGVAPAEGAIVLLAISIPGSLQLVKVVVGGSASTTDWTLSAEGPTPISGAGGVGPSNVDPGDYALSEVGGAGTENYLPSPWVCVGGVQSGDTITVAPGDVVVCTITNTSDVTPPPEFCILVPITTPPPSFATYPEPRERQGS